MEADSPKIKVISPQRRHRISQSMTKLDKMRSLLIRTIVKQNYSPTQFEHYLESSQLSLNLRDWEIDELQKEVILFKQKFSPDPDLSLESKGLRELEELFEIAQYKLFRKSGEIPLFEDNDSCNPSTHLRYRE